jgi:hypothetical protein
MKPREHESRFRGKTAESVACEQAIPYANRMPRTMPSIVILILSLNPKGILPQSPGLRACELPWGMHVSWDYNPEGVVPPGLSRMAQLRWGVQRERNKGSSRTRNPGYAELEGTIPSGLNSLIEDTKRPSARTCRSNSQFLLEDFQIT